MRLDVKRLEATQTSGWFHVWQDPRLIGLHTCGDCRDMVRRRPTAAADDIDQPTRGKFVQEGRGDGWSLIITSLTEGVRQTSIGIATDGTIGNTR